MFEIKMFEMMKVFDCQDMPKEVRNSLFAYYDNVGNDVYVTHYNEEEPDEDSPEFVQWLYDGGMTSKDEFVLIKHWW